MSPQIMAGAHTLVPPERRRNLRPVKPLDPRAAADCPKEIKTPEKGLEKMPMLFEARFRKLLLNSAPRFPLKGNYFMLLGIGSPV